MARFKGAEPGIRRGTATGRAKQARNALFEELRAKEKPNFPPGDRPFGKTIELVKKKGKKTEKPDGEQDL